MVALPAREGCRLMLLDVRHLTVRFEQRGADVYAVNGLSLQVQSGEIVAVVGESGAGKSQAFLALTGLVPENAVVGGEVWLDSRNLLALDEIALQKIRGARIAYVFQDATAALNPFMRVGQQLLEVVHRHRRLRGAAARDEVQVMLGHVRIADAATRMRQYPHQLSGGQRQRVVLAMALLGRPQLLIADEPTTALDVTVQRQILDLLKDLQAEFGFSLLLITHDLGVVAHTAHRVAVMYAGRIVESAPVRELFASPRHPYTKGLLAAAPRLHGGIPRPIKGVPPQLDKLPQGCPFAARCDDVTNRCQHKVPELQVGAKHHVVCQPEVVND